MAEESEERFNTEVHKHRSSTQQVQDGRCNEQGPDWERSFLNGLPDELALLDKAGVIVAVNTAWHRFASANEYPDPTHGVGSNYLNLCEAVQGEDRQVSRAVAAGVRQVLAGEAEVFQYEYPCHAPTRQRWFLLRAVPLSADTRCQRGIAAMVMHIDITDRKRAEQALRDNEERLRVALKGSPVTVYSQDRDLRYTWLANPTLAFDPDRVKGKRTHDLLEHVEEAEHLDALKRQVLSSGRGLRREVTLHHQGKRYHYDLTVEPLRDDAGQVRGVTCAAFDVTAYRQAGESLRDSERRFRTLVDRAPVGIYQADDQGQVNFCNSAWGSLTGLSPHEALGRGWIRALHPQDRDRVVTYWQRLVRDHEEGRLEWRFLRPDGQVVWVSGHAVVLQDTQGTVVGFLGTVVDITLRCRAEVALRESERRFRTLLHHAPVGIFETDAQGLCRFVNRYWCQMTGLTPEAALGRRWEQALHSEGRTQVSHQWYEAVRQGQPFDQECHFLKPDGQDCWVYSQAVALHDDRGEISGYMGIILDITEQKEARARLKNIVGEMERQRELLDTVLNASPDFILMHDRQGRYTYANQAALRAVDLTWEQMQGRTLRELDLPEQVVAAFEADFSRVLSRGEPVANLIHYPTIEGEWDLETLLTPVYDSPDHITRVVSVLRDVTERQTFQARLTHQATHDALTDLPNRTLLQDRLTHALDHARRSDQRVAVLFLDLVGFKRINDSLGHTAGDELLRCVAARLRAFVRDSDTVARMGGDEFVLVLEDLDQSTSETTLVHKAMIAFQEAFEVGGQALNMAARIGISLFPRDGDDSQTLLRNAATALHESRRNHRSSVRFYDHPMQERAVRRLTLEQDLRQALEDEALELYYQPQVSLRDGRVRSAEALLRWHHPRLGAVSPGQFIPIAEESGLILPLGEWVIRTACAQCRAWEEQGLGRLRVAVNLSARQFMQQDLPRWMGQVLSQAAIDPACLELEVTESMLVQDLEATIATLRAFREMGVKLAVDDFGTGYSSLSYLKRFPVDQLKIDQSFVRDLETDPNDAAIVQAVIALGHSLDLEVAAEGVETEAQLNFVRQRHCDIIQGYYFSRPLAVEAMSDLLRQGTTLSFKPSHDEHRAHTLLLVDDDARFLEAQSRLLRRDGYQVFTAADARSGLESLARHDIQVVVSDYRLPGMNGTDFLRRVRHTYPDTVRILLSGQSDRQALIEAINEGAIFQFLEKPISRERLRMVLYDAFLIHQARRDKPA